MQYHSLPNPEQFNESVWRLVRQVPAGRVVTYGQVAQMIESPADVEADTFKVFGSRWVGEAMAVCPADVPWQRVINSQGKISPRRGADKQRILLEAEGVQFVKDKIDLGYYQWRGANDADVPRQGRLF